MPSTIWPGIPKGLPLLNKSLPADALFTEVPIPYLLFSIIYKTGSFHKEAKLKASNTCPLFIAPSPIYVLHIFPSLTYLCVKATPVPIGT